MPEFKGVGLHYIENARRHYAWHAQNAGRPHATPQGSARMRVKILRIPRTAQPGLTKPAGLKGLQKQTLFRLALTSRTTPSCTSKMRLVRRAQQSARLICANRRRVPQSGADQPQSSYSVRTA